MKEKATALLEQGKTLLGKLSKKTKIAIVAALAVVLVLIVFLAVQANNRPYTPLFTDLSATEKASILSYLDTNGVTDYRVEGDAILIRSDLEAQYKAKLIMEGYPKSGLGYGTYLGNVSALSTDADRQAVLLFDLQDKLAAVIRWMDGVADANVSIVTGEDRRFVLDDSNVIQATAAVMVTMKEPGTKLTNDQVAAIRNLVSKSVSGLSIENVSITDPMGSKYSSGSVADAVGDATALKLALEDEWNNRIRNDIVDQLASIYGPENLRISVNTTVDVSRKVGEYTTHTTPEGAPDGRGIIGNDIYSNIITRDGDNAAGGVVGAGANADIPNYVEDEVRLQGNENYVEQSGERDYKVNSGVEQVEYLAGTITDLSVSVSLNATTAGSVDVEELKEHIGTIAKLTPEQRPTRISILVKPFYNPDQPVVPPVGDMIQLPPWAIYAAIAGGALFLLLLILILVLRRKKRKKKAAKLLEEASLAYMPGVQEPTGADIMNVRSEKSMELRKDIRSFAETNPEIAAQLIKGWLKEGGDDYG